MQEALVTGSLEGLVAPLPKTATPGPAQANTPAKDGSGSRAAGKRKLAASAAGSTAAGALLHSALVDMTRGCLLGLAEQPCCQAPFAP